MEFPQTKITITFKLYIHRLELRYIFFSEMEKLGKCVEKHSVKCPGEEGRMIEAHKPLFKLLLEGACSKGKTNFI